MSTTFTIEHLDHVAHLQLNRPEAYNSMTREFWSELPEAVRALDATGTTRALVISSTGKHFCAGMDLAVFTGGAGSDGAGAPAGSRETGRVRAQLRETVLSLQGTFTALEQARFPVLAAIQGGCIGGAVDMVSACDLRYASADAFFCVQEINIGMTADVGTLQRLPKIIPDGIAREMAYRGHRVPAARAREIGLVNEVFGTQEELVAGTLAIAQEIASKSPLAIWGTKEMATYTRDHPVADSLRHMAAWQSGMFQPADMMETFVAKGEGREPAFDDLLPHGTGL
ncbi:crotonase/enoyl-CoA hydratase family protein [Aquihabitans sp. McL0605]|uniref:crotonase/enoyl-CoA hydratase family protein n=1 Tax=Aquihabitans sp. McL0605 TaxID=3415671 RepID=UPI003CEBC568